MGIRVSSENRKKADFLTHLRLQITTAPQHTFGGKAGSPANSQAVACLEQAPHRLQRPARPQRPSPRSAPLSGALTALGTLLGHSGGVHATATGKSQQPVTTVAVGFVCQRSCLSANSGKESAPQGAQDTN